MAATFTLKSKAYDGRYLCLRCTQTPNDSANSSKIDWVLESLEGESNYYSTGPTTVKIGDTQVCSIGRKSYTTKEFPAARGSVGGALTVAHQPDGSLTLPVRLSTAIYGTTVRTVSGDWSLDAIDPVTRITATAGIIGQTIVLALTRYRQDSTHAIAYRFGAQSGWVGQGGEAAQEAVQHTQTALGFTLPEDFYSQIPDCMRRDLTLTCYTYVGEEVLGSHSCTVAVSADPAVCQPQLVATVRDENPTTLALTGDENTLIRFHSQVRCSLTATGRKGAWIVETAINGQSGTEQYITAPESGLFTFSATDSRGLTRQETVQKNLLPYIRLTCTASLKRKDPVSGEAVLTLSGNCFNGSLGVVPNPLQITCSAADGPLQPTLTETGYHLTATLHGLDYQQDHTVTVTVADALEQVSVQLQLSKGLPVFDWGARDFAFHVPVAAPSVSGLHICTLKPEGKELTLQSRFSEFYPNGGAVQSVLLFCLSGSSPVQGVAGLRSDGTAFWNGTPDITLTALDKGAFRLTLPNQTSDRLVLLSGDTIGGSV